MDLRGDLVRRLTDVVVALVVGVLMLPLALVIAATVRLSMGSPVLFRQQRSGFRGREFTIMKFRTMRAPRYEGESDLGRDTPVGRLLRGLSLDEIPQLWNVLRGDMSLIGPRPTLPEQVRCYDQRQRGRLAVRPGITGWAQVNGRNSISWPERITLDLWYIEHRSVRLDLRILCLTVLNVIRPHGVTADGGVNPGFPQPAPIPAPRPPVLDEPVPGAERSA
jgi:lipopolysaccharide/colanic/teichoic acid biosynthesis glycosyltransferase